MATNDNGIVQLLQTILNRGQQNQSMSEKIPGVGGTPVTPGAPGNIPINPASPDVKTVLGSIITQGSAMPGADKPMPQKQYPNTGTPSAYREYQTSGGHARAAIADIFGNVKEVIQTTEKNKEAKDARNLAIDIERLTLAMQNPNDPNNKLIIDDITHDAKRMKKIKEALNVNFMGDERDPVSKQAHSIAMKSIQDKMGAQQGQGQTNVPGAGNTQQPPQGQAAQQDPMAALRRQLGMPTVTTLSPEVQALNALKPETQKILLPTADQVLKSNTDLNIAMNNDASKEKLAAIVASTKDAELREKIFERLSKDNVEQLKGTIRLKVANIQASTILKKTQIIEDRLKSVQAKGDKELEDMIKQANSLTAQIKTAADQVKNTPEKGWIFKDSTSKDTAKKRLNNLQQQFDDLQKLINNKRMSGAISNGNNNTGSTFGTNDADELIKSIGSYEDITGSGSDE